MCYGYILLSLYPVPAKRWEDQRSWLYLGLAIRFDIYFSTICSFSSLSRVATELNLHLPVTTTPQEEKPAREVLNRARLWLNCFDLDRSTGAQYGKPPTINSIDYQANHSQNWWRSSPYNMRNFDIHLCCYNHELRTTANFISKIYDDPENPTGLNEVFILQRGHFLTEADNTVCSRKQILRRLRLRRTMNSRGLGKNGSRS